MMIRSNFPSLLEQFQMLHSEIIEYYQCIEYDMRRIYSAMSSEDFSESMEYLSDKNWGVILKKLERLDKSDNEPFLTDEEYQVLDEIRTRRNYWCHQCYLDFAYIQNDYERNDRLRRLTRQLENEHNRAAKLQRKMQELYIEYFT